MALQLTVRQSHRDCLPGKVFPFAFFRASGDACSYRHAQALPLGELSCSMLPEPRLLGGVWGRSRALAASSRAAFAASSRIRCSSSNLSISDENTVMRLCQLMSPGPVCSSCSLDEALSGEHALINACAYDPKVISVNVWMHNVI